MQVLIDRFMGTHSSELLFLLLNSRILLLQYFYRASILAATHQKAATSAAISAANFAYLDQASATFIIDLVNLCH